MQNPAVICRLQGIINPIEMFPYVHNPQTSFPNTYKFNANNDHSDS